MRTHKLCEDALMKILSFVLEIGLFAACALLSACSGGIRLDGSEGLPDAADAGSADASEADGPPQTMPACDKDCGGGSCENGICTPVQMSAIIDLGCPVLDATHIYVADPNGARILRMPKTSHGNELQVVALDAGEPRWVEVRDGWIYWTSQPLGVFRAPSSGGEIQHLAPSNEYVGPIAVDKNHIYVSDAQVFGSILSVPIGGGMLTPLVSFVWRPMTLAVDEEAVYYSETSGAAEKIHKFTFADQKDTMLCDAQYSPYFIDIDESQVYWTSSSVSGSVWSISKQGGQAAKLTEGFDHPGGLDLWGEHIYFVVFGMEADSSGWIGRVPKNGGPVETLVPARHQPVCLTADENAIYWVEKNGLFKWVR